MSEAQAINTITYKQSKLASLKLERQFVLGRQVHTDFRHIELSVKLRLPMNSALT